MEVFLPISKALFYWPYFQVYSFELIIFNTRKAEKKESFSYICMGLKNISIFCLSNLNYYEYLDFQIFPKPFTFLS